MNRPQPSRIALVMGGNRGIGFEICRGLARYDDRALLGQTLLAWLVLPVTYLITQREKNINWVFGPGKPQTRLSPVAYLGLLMAVMPFGIYVPTHLLLRALF